MILNVSKGTFTSKDEQAKTFEVSIQIHSTLHVKDKFLILNEANHELSMTSNFPSSSQIKKLTVSMNSQCDIQNCPNRTICVQQSIKARILQSLTHSVQKVTKEGISVPTTIRINLTGDGMRIVRDLNIISVAFTILEEGSKTYSILGNYIVAILKASETYDVLP